MIRTPVVLGFLFTFILAGSLGVAVAAPVASAPAPAVHATTSPVDPTLSPDPVFGAAEITTQTATVLHCPCIIGVNCCGDIENYPNRCGGKTDKKGVPICRCGAGGCIQ